MYERGAVFTRAVMSVVRAERELQRLTINEFARRADFNRSTLTRYLYEEQDVPISALYRIAVALNLEASEIVARAEADLSGQSGEASSSQKQRPDQER